MHNRILSQHGSLMFHNRRFPWLLFSQRCSSKVDFRRMARIKKLRPVSEDESPLGYEHVSGCLRYFFVALTNLLIWSGFVPFKIDRQTGTMEFKLISFSSLFAFVRLCLTTFSSSLHLISVFVSVSSPSSCSSSLKNLSSSLLLGLHFFFCVTLVWIRPGRNHADNSPPAFWSRTSTWNLACTRS